MNDPVPAHVTLVVVDDSELVRAGLRAVLSHCDTLNIVGEASTVRGAVETVTAWKPAVVLLDIRLPDGTGFDACRQILAAAPETRVLFLTSVVNDDLVAEAISCGGHGYLLKEIDGRGLIAAILDVAAGKSIIAPEVTARVINLVRSGAAADALASLSPQERRVLALIAEGRTNKEVGAELNLSEKTVKNYLASVFDKLNVTRRSQAVARFVAAQR